MVFVVWPQHRKELSPPSFRSFCSCSCSPRLHQLFWQPHHTIFADIIADQTYLTCGVVGKLLLPWPRTCVALEFKDRASVFFTPDSEQPLLLHVKLFNSGQPCSVELFQDPICVPLRSSPKLLIKCLSGERPLACCSSPPLRCHELWSYFGKGSPLVWVSALLLFWPMTGHLLESRCAISPLSTKHPITERGGVLDLECSVPRGSMAASGAPADPQGLGRQFSHTCRFPTPWTRKPGHWKYLNIPFKKPSPSPISASGLISVLDLYLSV